MLGTVSLKLDKRGSAAAISVLIMTPILMSLVVLAYTSASVSQTDQNVGTIAKNAARAAAICCGDSADAAVAAENVARSGLSTNSILCRNLRSATQADQEIGVAPIVEVSFISGRDSLGNFNLLSKVENPRSFKPSELRQRLGTSLQTSRFIRVRVFCELNFQSLTGFWLPFGRSIIRVGDFTVIVDTAVSQ